MAPVTKNYWRVFASQYRVPQGICCCDSKLYLYIHYNSKWHDTKREPEMQDSTSLFSFGFNRRTLNVCSCSGEVTNFSTNHMHLMIGVFLLLGQGGMQVSQSREEKHSQTYIFPKPCFTVGLRQRDIISSPIVMHVLLISCISFTLEYFISLNKFWH